MFWVSLSCISKSITSYENDSNGTESMIFTKYTSCYFILNWSPHHADVNINFEYVHFFLVSVAKARSQNVTIYYQSPWNDDTRCNWYGKDGNTGPDYDCNQIGSEVAIRNWNVGPLGLCNIEVYGGK